MKAKTKDQLRAEIVKLEKDRDYLKQELKDTQDHFVGAISSFSIALRMTLENHPDRWNMLALLVTRFFAELRRITGLDFHRFTEEWLDEILAEDIGFDEVTSTVIKQRLGAFFQISKMLHEGVSAEEVEKFVRKNLEEEGSL